MNVLDASAVLAILQQEAGADEVVQRLNGSIMSTVNLTEVLQQAQKRGLDPRDVHAELGNLGVGFVAFDLEQTLDAAELWESTRRQGLSLADRACLALTMAVSGVAVTADRAWGQLELGGCDIHLIR